MSETYCPANGKMRFATPGLAERIMRKDSKKKGRMTIYICGTCGGYHLGRKRERRKTNWRRNGW